MSARKKATLYDLMVLIAPERDAAEREGIVANCKRLIEAGGELVRHDPWGVRELAYPIKHHQHAEYHLFQFRPASPEVLRELDRTLRIADGVLRFRIVKLAPGTPEPPRVGVQEGGAAQAAQPAAPAEELPAEPAAADQPA
jgi:small subunit ribosomal protein S6